jgi:hypothetical protein
MIGLLLLSALSWGFAEERSEQVVVAAPGSVG